MLVQNIIEELETKLADYREIVKQYTTYYDRTIRHDYESAIADLERKITIMKLRYKYESHA